MRRKLGTCLMLSGAALVLCALALLLHNRLEARTAAQNSADTLPQLLENLQSVPDSYESGIEYQPSAQQTQPNERYSLTMPEVEVDGYGYLGVLVLPTLELELPVLADWDEERLRLAPCRYSGSLPSENMVIAGHNYDGHFGTLHRLRVGDEVLFVDMNAKTYRFTVSAVELLEPQDVEQMTAGEYPLTLFTCTFGAQQRITIRCDYEEND